MSATGEKSGAGRTHRGESAEFRGQRRLLQGLGREAEIERGGGSRCGGSVLGVEERAWPGRGLKEVQGAEPEAASRE